MPSPGIEEKRPLRMNSNQQPPSSASQDRVLKRQPLLAASANRLLNSASASKSQPFTAAGILAETSNRQPIILSAPDPKSSIIKQEPDAHLAPTPIENNAIQPLRPDTETFALEYHSPPAAAVTPIISAKPRSTRRSNVPESRRRTFLNINQDLELIKICVRYKHEFRWGNKRNFWPDVGQALSERIGRNYMNSETRMTTLVEKRKRGDPKLTAEHVRLLDEWIEWVDEHRNKRPLEWCKDLYQDPRELEEGTKGAKADTQAQAPEAKARTSEVREQCTIASTGLDDAMVDKTLMAGLVGNTNDGEYNKDGVGAKIKPAKIEGRCLSSVNHDNSTRMNARDHWSAARNKRCRGEELNLMDHDNGLKSDNFIDSAKASTKNSKRQRTAIDTFGSIAASPLTNGASRMSAKMETPTIFRAVTLATSTACAIDNQPSIVFLRFNANNTMLNSYQGDAWLNCPAAALSPRMIQDIYFAPGSPKLYLAVCLDESKVDRIYVEFFSLQERSDFMARLHKFNPGHQAICKDSCFIEEVFAKRLGHRHATSLLSPDMASKNDNDPMDFTTSASSVSATSEIEPDSFAAASEALESRLPALQAQFEKYDTHRLRAILILFGLIRMEWNSTRRKFRSANKDFEGVRNDADDLLERVKDMERDNRRTRLLQDRKIARLEAEVQRLRGDYELTLEPGGSRR